MKTDLYTKTILTVIAAALILLIIQNTTILNEAKAGKTNFNSFASIPINSDGSINVKFLTEQMDVNVKSIGGSSVYGTLPMNLKEISGSSFSGAFPVNFKELGGGAIGTNGLSVNIEAVDGVSIYNAIPVKEVK